MQPSNGDRTADSSSLCDATRRRHCSDSYDGGKRGSHRRWSKMMEVAADGFGGGWVAQSATRACRDGLPVSTRMRRWAHGHRRCGRRRVPRSRGRSGQRRCLEMEQATRRRTRRRCGSPRLSSTTRGILGLGVDDDGRGARTEQHGEAGRWQRIAEHLPPGHGNVFISLPY
jgi:hypothetical protein